MKKNIIFSLLLINISILYAQHHSQHISINWIRQEQTATRTNTDINSLYFDGATSQGITGLLPYYSIEIPLKEGQSITDIYLTNRTEKSFQVSGQFLQNAQPDLSNSYHPNFFIKNTNLQKIGVITFPTVKKGTLAFVLDKLISCDLEYSIFETKAPDNISRNKSFDKQSAMSSGDWYQFSLDRDGVYKITYSDIVAAGINIDGTASSKIKMYGFGGMLSEKNIDFRYPDIPEVAIEMMDGGDGSFDAGDYFLFYAQGPDSWNHDQINKVFHHQLNIYSRKANYFLVISDGDGERISTINSAQNANYSVNSFTDYGLIEDENYNLINSGRRWFGDRFEFTTNYNYELKFDHIKSESPVYFKAVTAARSTKSSTFTIKVLDQTKTINIAAIPGGSYPSYAVGGQKDWTFNYTGSSNSLAISVDYNQPLSGSVGWLDYIEVNVQRDLILSGNQMRFRNPESVKPSRISEFTLQNAGSEAMEIWDVTDPTNPLNIKYTIAGNSVKFSTETSVLKEFIAYQTASALKPVFVKQIDNQNLHAEINHDYIIITNAEFQSQAEELAQYHRDHNGLDVFVTSLQPIYNEFSSGRQDISAIRDFLKCVYDNSSENHRLKYVLLFGDASMDYLQRDANNTNMVPTWESYESFNPISSIATDDFFGFLDDDEGGFDNDQIDVGIGRFPVVNTTEAQEMVDKVKHYQSTNENVLSDWRNSICFIADDEDGNLHLDQANDLSILVDSIYPTANLDKIFVDAYQQESTPAGQRYPKVNQAINERIDKGSLIISYTGHGGEVGWGQERYLDVPDILSWTNTDKLAVFLTATCEFARYDDPARVSAGELIFLNKRGGGISLFTTARATYAGSNFVVSTNFYKTALTKVNGTYPRMGDIIKAVKIMSGSGVNVQKFILLGDPALHISMPKNQIEITSIKNTNTNLETDTIKALSNITITGAITNANNQIITNFNGSAYPTIYDKPVNITTLGNDAGSPIYTFSLQKNILYKGKADVVNGRFEFSFIVPKDIAYKYGNGKISIYAENGEQDAAGYLNDIVIGGYDDNTAADDDGPQIQLYINNDDFIPGGLTNENPILFAYIFDNSGINATGNGIGHDISATLDNDDNNVKILNDYYVSDANSYKSGAISFPYFKLADGPHTLELKVWDIHNNSNKASINFVVASSANMALDQLFNYPNPVNDFTTFSFEHNQANENLEITVDVYSIDGKLATSFTKKMLTNGYRNNQIDWDVTDESGNRIKKGVYIYRMIVKSESGKEASETAKLVILK